MPTVFWGVAGTATVQLTIPIREKNEIVTKTLEGCLVKKDANLRSFIEENFKDQSADRNKLERSKYLFYAPNSDFEGDVTEATLTYPEISKKWSETRQKMTDCTVKEPLIIRVHGHLFLCCDSQLKESTFLETSCKEVRISQSLDGSKKFCGLGSEKNGQLVFTSFGMSQYQSSYGLLERSDYEKLKDAGPLLLDDNKTAVGCFRKTNDCRILLLIFGRNQVLGGSAEPLPSGSRVDGSPTDLATFPPGGSSSDQTPTPANGGSSSGQTPTPPAGGSSSGQTPTPPAGGSSSDQTPTPPPGGSSSGQTPTPPPGASSGQTPTAPPGGSSGQTPTPPPGGSSTDSSPTPPPDSQSGSTSAGGSYAADGASSPTQQQEPIVVYRSHEAARKASMSGNAVDAPGSPVRGAEKSPSQPATNSPQMAAGGLSNDPVENTDFPTEEEGEPPGRENTPSLATGSSRRNDQTKLPQRYEDIIDKDDMKYRRYLLHIAEKLTNDDWKRLGGRLEVPFSDLETIEADYSEQVKERAYQMLIKWTEYTPKPTLEILIDALNKTGQRQLVDEISDYLGDTIGQMQGGTPVRDVRLQDIISDIQEDWKFIGRYLGLKESDIGAIRRNYRGIYERACQMLIKWKKENGDMATFEVLMVASKNVGKENVVGKLEDLRKKANCPA